MSIKNTNAYGTENATYSTLHPVLHGDNPDLAYNLVPFEKGFQLIYYLESVVLDSGAVQSFMNYYIEHNNLMSICAFRYRETFSAFVESYIENDDQVNQILDMVDYESWIYVNGNEPTGMLSFANSQTDAAQQLAWDYISLGGASSPANFADYNTWPINQ